MTALEISEAAQAVCAKYFLNGAKCSVTSHRPHEALSRDKAAFDELEAAGLITQQPYNRFGSVQYTGTDEAGRIGRDYGKRLFERMRWDDGPCEPAPALQPEN